MSINTELAEVISLGVTSAPPVLHHVELTFNLPQTSNFLLKLSHQQKKDYIDRYSKIYAIYSKYIYDSDYKFEFTASGQVHMHAVWLLDPPKGYSTAGFISDVAKLWIMSLASKYRKYYPKCLYNNPDNVKYQAPSISASYHINREERFFIWVEYINKFSHI